MTNPLDDFEPMKLPDPDIAQLRGWKYQVDWFDEAANRPCFYRAKSLLEAEAWADANLQKQRHYIRDIPHE